MNKLNLYQKLLEVRKSVPYLQKENGEKGKGVGYKYVSSSQTLASVRNKMDELGIILEPEILESKVTQNIIKSTDRYTNTPKETISVFTELTMTMTFVDCDNPNDKIVKKWYSQGTDPFEKGVGKALTYGEKYFILKFFNIATDEDDPDLHAQKQEPNKESKENKQTTSKQSTKEDKPKQEDRLTDTQKNSMKSIIRQYLNDKDLEKITSNNGKMKANIDIDSYTDKQLCYVYAKAKEIKSKNEVGGLPV